MHTARNTYGLVIKNNAACPNVRARTDEPCRECFAYLRTHLLAALLRRDGPRLGADEARAERVDTVRRQIQGQRARQSLDGNKGGGARSEGSSGGYSKSNTASYGSSAPASQPDYADAGITDDDIPF